MKEKSTVSKNCCKRKSQTKKKKSRELVNLRCNEKFKKSLIKREKCVERKLPSSPTKKLSVIEVLGQICSIIPTKKSSKGNRNIDIETQKFFADFCL